MLEKNCGLFPDVQQTFLLDSEHVQNIAIRSQNAMTFICEPVLLNELFETFVVVTHQDGNEVPFFLVEGSIALSSATLRGAWWLHLTFIFPDEWDLEVLSLSFGRFL